MRPRPHSVRGGDAAPGANCTHPGILLRQILISNVGIAQQVHDYGIAPGPQPAAVIVVVRAQLKHVHPFTGSAA